MSSSHDDDPVVTDRTGAAASVRTVAVPAETMAQHLLSAGLDLNYVLMFFDDCSRGADRVRHAIDEIDAAIVGLRHLVVEVNRP